jgi:hydrogenase expression/formation protein HypC
MQVLAIEPGHASCAGRGATRRVRTALVGDVKPGDWLLVFIDSAQERLEPQRAREIDATLDLLDVALAGAASGAVPDAAFDLPSRWTTDQLRALSGAPSPETTEGLP